MKIIMKLKCNSLSMTPSDWRKRIAIFLSQSERANGIDFGSNDTIFCLYRVVKQQQTYIISTQMRTYCKFLKDQFGINELGKQIGKNHLFSNCVESSIPFIKSIN